MQHILTPEQHGMDILKVKSSAILPCLKLYVSKYVYAQNQKTTKTVYRRTWQLRPTATVKSALTYTCTYHDMSSIRKHSQGADLQRGWPTTSIVEPSSDSQCRTRPAGTFSQRQLFYRLTWGRYLHVFYTGLLCDIQTCNLVKNTTMQWMMHFIQQCKTRRQT